MGALRRCRILTSNMDIKNDTLISAKKHGHFGVTMLHKSIVYLFQKEKSRFFHPDSIRFHRFQISSLSDIILQTIQNHWPRTRLATSILQTLDMSISKKMGHVCWAAMNGLDPTLSFTVACFARKSFVRKRMWAPKSYFFASTSFAAFKTS